ncbi:MAG: hypothetical protein A2161_17505 [Candidatus Schekmanbacteria bacterium RBG_13_48_7]|uniref:DUF4160 domain-containing protein n=1 Tax=Candidatus Schekmanbacteria bacterium RBG_13_48_7 TaxID=1817878 RepID=A0A1F7S2A5_9BACT|nr:MAG: hypothetical protein A2161_17505 [Candidatus Schekmanbacteria bacterium RBG_13_48_7]
MPKLYEYFGLIILFYSNEHQPIHVHGKYQDRENKAEFIILDGKVTEIKYSSVRGKDPLTKNDMKKFKTLIEYFKDDIVQKWIDFFVLNKEIKAEKITQKIG